MKRVDFSETGICDISWSPNGEWLTYVRNEDEICRVRLIDGEPTVVSRGSSPCFNSDNNIIFEQTDEIFLNAGGKNSLIIGKADVVSGTPKRRPCVSPDGKKLVFVVDSVFHKESESRNAYPYRSFLGIANATGSASPKILGSQQWYGGTVTWFPGNESFLHYEFDSTGGARIHMSNLKGEKLGTIFGLFPAISPDEKRLACKPKGGQSVVVYVSKGEAWDMEDVDIVVTKLPEGGRLTGSPPIWIDNRFVLIDEAGKVFRVDTRKQEAEVMKKIPTPVQRGTQTMSPSPSRDRIAVETQTDSGFELHVVDL